MVESINCKNSITLPRINKNQEKLEKYVTSNFISSFHIFTFIVRFCDRSSNDVDTSTKLLMETRKTQSCCHRNTRLAEKCFIVSRYNGSCSKVHNIYISTYSLKIIQPNYINKRLSIFCFEMYFELENRERYYTAMCECPEIYQVKIGLKFLDIWC